MKRPKHRPKGKRGDPERRAHLEERRFTPAQTGPTWTAFAVGGAGAVAAGVGVYANWWAEPAYSWALWPLVLGVGALAGAVAFGDSALPVRVGDVGVAIEKGNELVRLTWAALERVEIRGGQLVLEAHGTRMGIPVGSHQRAIAWILSEGTRRVPEVMNVKASALDALPKPREEDGERLAVEDLQLAGKKCKKSGKPISYERDARLCPNCAEVYHRDTVPKTCVTCEQPLGSSAIAPTS